MRQLDLAHYKCKRLYIKGSLSNIDLNDDGIPDGFQFMFKSPIRFCLFALRDLKIVLNGRKINSSKIYVIAKGKSFEVNELSGAGFRDTICREGEEIKVVVEKKGGLEKEKHYVIELWATLLNLEGCRNILLAYVEDKL